jgi:hypothetical protein
MLYFYNEILDFRNEILDFTEELQQFVNFLITRPNEDISNHLTALTTRLMTFLANSAPTNDFCLDLNDIYNLKELSSGHLKKILGSLPKKITSLYLNGREFWYGEGMQFIPKHITSLGLRFYGSILGSSTLINVFGSIPDHINSLDLKGNKLAHHYNNKNIKVLKEAFGKLHTGISKLDLRDNELEKYTDDEINSLFSRSARLAIRLNDRILHTLVPKLICSVKDKISHLSQQVIFEVISPTLVIDEADLQQLVHILEKQGTPMAYLTAGLLLEGRMGVSVVNAEKDDSYMEKRIQDAITFYIKAAENPNIKPLVDFILWEIKTTKIEFSSIQQRLAELDINPEKFFDTYASYSKFRQSVVAPLYRSWGMFKPSPQTTSEVPRNNQVQMGKK